MKTALALLALLALALTATSALLATPACSTQDHGAEDEDDGTCTGAEITHREIHIDIIVGRLTINVIYITGDILQGDEDRFEEYMTTQVKPGPTTVILNSNDSNTGAALGIGKYISEHKYNTHVHAGAQCNAACVLIWLAGEKRTMHSSARIGVLGETTNAWVVEWLADLGWSTSVRDLVLKADPGSVSYIDYDLAREYKMTGPWPPKTE